MTVVLTTHPSESSARKLAEELVQNGHAACVQVEGPLFSTYTWSGKLEKSAEWRMVLKTLPEKVEDAYRYVCQNHPFEVPQWVVIPAQASADYFSWLQESIPRPPH